MRVVFKHNSRGMVVVVVVSQPGNGRGVFPSTLHFIWAPESPSALLLLGLIQGVMDGSFFLAVFHCSRCDCTDGSRRRQGCGLLI